MQVLGESVGPTSRAGQVFVSVDLSCRLFSSTSLHSTSPHSLSQPSQRRTVPAKPLFSARPQDFATESLKLGLCVFLRVLPHLSFSLSFIPSLRQPLWSLTSSRPRRARHRFRPAGTTNPNSMTRVREIPNRGVPTYLPDASPLAGRWSRSTPWWTRTRRTAPTSAVIV